MLAATREFHEAMHPLQWSSHTQLSIPICLTSNVFHPQNRLLADIIRSEAADTPRQFVCAVDQEFADRQPEIVAHATAYVQQPPLFGEFVAQPLMLRAHETSTGDLAQFISLRMAMREKD